MTLNEDYKSFILDHHLSGFGKFEIKNQFGATALLSESVTFA
jgi:hypothetical protein